MSKAMELAISYKKEIKDLKRQLAEAREIIDWLTNEKLKEKRDAPDNKW